MKKLIQINTVCNTSTGKLMGDIQRKADELGYETLSIVGRRKVFSDMRCEKIGNAVSFWIHVVINTIFDRQGYGSYFVTRKIIRSLREEDPDIIHLHNLHGYYLNLPVLFDYLSKEFRGKVFWTFHDCWPITGHCAYFTAIGCEKWRQGCNRCPNKRVYPTSLFADASGKNYKDKKRMFNSLDNLVIITPSEWEAALVKDSFLGKYPIRVVNNGIDLKTFTYRNPQNQIYNKYHINREKKIILGVASIWERRKGLEDFVSLAARLPLDYQIVLVGLSKRQMKKLPENMLGIERTESKEELAEVYSLADFFMNPSREESFSLVTAEALACGTPAIVLNTSAVKELICDDNGIVLSDHKPEDYIKAIEGLENRQLSRETVMKTALKYDVNAFAEKVISLYQEAWDTQ